MSAAKHDTAKPRLSLVPPHSLNAVIDVMEYGATKYEAHNWKGGMEYSRCFNSAFRHMWAWWRGEYSDPESGLPHLAHAICGLMFLLDWQKMGVGTDDRDKVS
jgi:hypothetical protein